MMNIKRLRTLYFDDNDESYTEICSLSLVSNNRDLYFSDKSSQFFHISIHKDGNVFFSPQNNNDNKKSEFLFKFDWEIVDNDVDYEKPFLFYIPMEISNYPKVNYNKSRTFNAVLHDMIPEDLLIKYFIISDKAINPKARTQDISFKLTKEEGKTKDGIEFKNDLNEVPSVLKFNNQSIRYDVDKMNFTSDSIRDVRFLFLCQPSIKLDVVKFINENTFYIDREAIRRQRYSIKKYKYNGIDLALIAY